MFTEDSVLMPESSPPSSSPLELEHAVSASAPAAAIETAAAAFRVILNVPPEKVALGHPYPDTGSADAGGRTVPPWMEPR
jgi:hypothetical protein